LARNVTEMNWSELRTTYPDQWLIIEAIEAHTTADSHRVLHRLAVIEACPDGATAMQRYRQIHQEFPQREFYFVHTSREELVVRERQWLGVRKGDATLA